MADVVEAEEKFTKVLDRLALQLQPEIVEEDEGHLGWPLGLVEGGPVVDYPTASHHTLHTTRSTVESLNLSNILTSVVFCILSQSEIILVGQVCVPQKMLHALTVFRSICCFFRITFLR